MFTVPFRMINWNQLKIQCWIGSNSMWKFARRSSQATSTNTFIDRGRYKLCLFNEKSTSTANVTPLPSCLRALYALWCSCAVHAWCDLHAFSISFPSIVGTSVSSTKTHKSKPIVMKRKIRIDKYREYKYSRRSNDKKVVRLYAHANLIDVKITSNAYRTQPTN